MKFSKGTVSNISKKIIAGTLTLAFVVTSLTGCAKDFNYSKEVKNGHYVVQVDGVMKSSVAENLKVIELNVDGESVLFLARREEKQILLENGNEGICYDYWDVFKNFKILSLMSEKETNPLEMETGIEIIKVVKEQSLKNYLQYYGYKNKQYTIDDLRKIFEKIQEDYVFENNKKLVKEK